MEVNQGADRELIRVPKEAEIYKQIYGWVDRGNQQLSFYNTEFRIVRKQCCVLDILIEMYVSVNGRTLWRNSPMSCVTSQGRTCLKANSDLPLYVFGMQSSEIQMEEWRSFTTL